MATYEELMGALRKADAAGDTEGARRLAQMAREAKGAPPKQEGGFMQSVGDFADAASNQFGLGFKDEVQAAGRAAMDWVWSKFNPEDQGKGYGEHLAALEQQRGQRYDRSPVASIAGDIAGAVTSPITRLLTPAMTAPTMLGKVGQGAHAGARLGAAYGFGNTEGTVADRVMGMGQGALVGGVTGGAIPPIVDGLSRGANVVVDQTINRMKFRQPQAAMRKIAEALERDGLTPQQAMQRIQQLGPQGALMDVGPNSQALARAVYTAPGDGKKAIGDFLTARQEGTRAADNTLQGGQINRVISEIDNLIPDRSGTIRAGAQAARNVAGTEYNTARGANAMVDIRPVLQNIDDQLVSAKGSIRDGLMKVRSYLVNADGAPETTVDALHQAKMAIDDLMSGEARGSMGRVSKALIRQSQDDLVSAIEQAAPNYRAGRLGTAGAWRIDEALDAGEQFMLKRVFSNADDLTSAVAKMSPEEQHAFRVGAAQAIKNKLSEMNTRSDVTKRVMDIPALEQKIRSAFGDQQTFSRYIDMLKNERSMFDTYGKIMGGSRTGELIAEQADMAIDPGRAIQGMTDLATGTPTGIIRGAINLAGAAKDRVALPGPIRGRLAQMLTGQDTQALQQMYQSKQLPAAARRRLSQLLIEGGAPQSSRYGQ